MLTKMAAAAPTSPDDCPCWVRFLTSVTGGDAAMTRFLQQWSGLCLTGDASTEELVFAHGPAGSGKSTFVETIAAVMAEHAVHTPSETLMLRKHPAHREELARLHGARLVWSSEIEDGARWNERRIAELTGDATVTARYLYGQTFTYRRQFKLMVVGNSRPDLHDVGGAMRRRFNVVPFDRPHAHVDAGLKPYLLSGAEHPGILAWMIAGALDWQANGLVKPPRMQEATHEYLEAQDTFGQWIAERCETGDRLADTTANLRESWESFAPFGIPHGRNPFADRMQGRGFQGIKDEHGIRGRGYLGIRVREDGI